MDSETVARHCEDLRKLIERGPREDPIALDQALALLGTLAAATHWDYPRGKLVDLEHNFRRWFSDRRWRGTDEGSGCRAELVADIAAVESSWERQSTAKEE